MRRTIVLVAATLLAGAAHASETTSDDRHEVINKEKQAQSRTPATREEASEGAKKAAEEAANPGNTGTGASDASDATSVDRHEVINKEKQAQSKTPAAREEASEGAKKAAEEAANPGNTGTGASDASDATSVDRHQVINEEKQVQSKTPAAREEASEGAKKAAEEAANPESTPK